MPGPFATSADATGFAYPLPAATADGLLARATQAIIDAAGFGVLEADATVKIRAEHWALSLDDVPLVTAVSAVELVHDDGTTEAVTAWHFEADRRRILLGHQVPGRHCGLFAVTLTQGLPSVPVSLKLLASSVAYRFAAMPAGMSAGVTQQSVGGVSWSASKAPPSGGLTDGELCKLAKIIPVKRLGVTRL